MPKWLLTFLVIFSTFWVAFPSPISASSRDLRPLKLASFLSKRNSQLGYLAPIYVAEADRYGLDYRLLVAISGVESTFGQAYIQNTYNIYGWGAGIIPFASWQDGIATVSEHLRTDYADKGASDLSTMAKIYCPPNPTHWANGVQQFMTEIDQTQINEALPLGGKNELNPPDLDLTI